MKLPNAVQRALGNDRKTTLIGVVGAGAVLAARYGFQLSLDEQMGIVMLTCFVLGFFSSDSK